MLGLIAPVFMLSSWDLKMNIQQALQKLAQAKKIIDYKGLVIATHLTKDLVLGKLNDIPLLTVMIPYDVLLRVVSNVINNAVNIKYVIRDTSFNNYHVLILKDLNVVLWATQSHIDLTYNQVNVFNIPEGPAYLNMIEEFAAIDKSGNLINNPLLYSSILES